MQLKSIKNLQIIQMVEQSLPAPEILQFETSLWEILFAVNCIENDTGMVHQNWLWEQCDQMARLFVP